MADYWREVADHLEAKLKIATEALRRIEDTPADAFTLASKARDEMWRIDHERDRGDGYT